ncbi:hypothetical protein ABPG75_003173 [Micractinium tetrahymenae]
MDTSLKAMDTDAEAGACADSTIGALSDDLLAQCFAVLDDGTLRVAAGTCRRWAALLRERAELFRSVRFDLPPKRSRGRDRRNSYTTPCALNVERLAAWLARRAGAIAQLRIGLLYPDALALLPRLLPPLAPALRRLALEGGCVDWPYLWVDWRWLAGMTQLESLELRDALPGMAELLLPPSLTKLLIDRVGEGEQETEGWDELPDCFSRLTRLRSVTLGTAATYLLQADEESALAPLRPARGLQELRLPDGALSAVPDVVAEFRQLTLLSFRGCDKLEAFGDTCLVKQDPFLPLASLQNLRCLDFSSCGLESLPPHLGSLPLRTLLLANNRLMSLPAPAAVDAAAARQASGAGRGAGAAAAAVQPQPAAALPPLLEHLDVSGNAFQRFPAGPLCRLSGLTHLDLSRCWAMPTAAADWRGLLAALPALRQLRHSCALLAAEERGHGGAAGLAAALGACPDLELRRVPPPGEPRRDAALGGGKRARSTSSLEQLEEAAAAALLAAPRPQSGSGSGGCAGGGSREASGAAALAQLLAAAGCSRGAIG